MIINPEPVAGLTGADASRIAAIATAAYAPATRKVYACGWRQWVRWCERRDLVPLPGDPAAVCAYLTERAESGRCYGTIDMDCCAIAFGHRERGLPDPVAHDAVRRVRRGLRRTLGNAPHRLAHRSPQPRSARSWPPSTAPRPAVPATPP